MKPTSLAGMVITLFVWSSGEVVAQEKAKPDVKYAISIGTKIQYWLQIHSDGSGTVGYGAGGSYQGFFKAGTFDVEKVTKELKALKLDPKGNWNTHFYFGFESERKGQEPGPRYYTLDSEYIPALFKKAGDSSWNKETAFPYGFDDLRNLNKLKDLKKD